jgi:hypothetical protein
LIRGRDGHSVGECAEARGGCGLGFCCGDLFADRGCRGGCLAQLLFDVALNNGEMIPTKKWSDLDVMMAHTHL